MDEESFYKELVKRYSNKTATEEEVALFFHLLKEGVLKETLTSSMDEYWEETETTTPAVVKRFGRSTLLRWTVAAAAVITLIFGSYFLFFNKKPLSKESQIAIQNDVPPGINKATLTLGNGTVLMLDSTSNGLLATQSGSKIIKTDSGHLSYSASTAKPTNKEIVTLNTLTTPRGGQFQLSLPDGTKVWLNASSSITYPVKFTGDERKVSLTGEAYFEVAHDDKKPFYVKSGDLTIQDIGTAFNVNSYPDEPAVTTTLVEGSVKVSSGAESKTLTRGEQSRLSGKSFTIKDNVDIHEITAWKDGLFDFESADLKTILRQFARWYDIEVVYQGSMPQDKYFVIIKRSSNLSAVLKALQASGIRFQIEGKKLIVKPG